ncbi:hypothetical protein, partial [Nocardia cyriacigeorgica]|uniref:hypothetical protein n=1 Tax=Nocardia cyriacigeorgica TaxID=135487 RepID=UPI002457F9B0
MGGRREQGGARGRGGGAGGGGVGGGGGGVGGLLGYRAGTGPASTRHAVAARLVRRALVERPADQQQAADTKHARFVVENSDFLAYLRLWD